MQTELVQEKERAPEWEPRQAPPSKHRGYLVAAVLGVLFLVAAIVGIATDAKLETDLPTVHLDDIPAIAVMMQASALPIADVLARAGT